MKVGDLVMHDDGDVGVVLTVKVGYDPYPYFIWFRQEQSSSWFSDALINKLF